MKKKEWKEFCAFREEFKLQIAQWQKQYPEEVDFVYNKALDEILESDKIEYIIVGDNPGEAEKSAERYFVGKAGQQCRKFFEESLQVEESDFDACVIALNKTPISTKKTTDLLKEAPQALVEETQKWMAERIAKLCIVFKCDPYIIGMSQLAPGKIFSTFAQTLEDKRCSCDPAYEPVNSEEVLFGIHIFKHFSHGHYIKDLDACCHFYENKYKKDGKKEFEVDHNDADEENDMHVEEPDYYLDDEDAGFYLRMLGFFNTMATLRKFYPRKERQIVEEIKINEKGEVECYNAEGQLILPDPILPDHKKDAVSVEKTKNNSFKVSYHLKGKWDRKTVFFNNKGGAGNPIISSTK